MRFLRNLSKTALFGGAAPAASSGRRIIAAASVFLAFACSSEPGAEPGNATTSSGGNPSVPDDSTGGVVDGSGGLGTGGLGSGGSSDPLGGGGTLGSGGSDVLPGVGGTGGASDEPISYSTEVVIEEEAPGFCAVDGIIETTNAGFSGIGYANSDNTLGAQIEWVVSVGEPGTYSLEFVYSNGGDADRTGSVAIGGAEAVASASFPVTTGWTTWSTASFDVALAAGENYISLSATTAAGLSNIDRITIRGAAVAALSCAPEVGTGGSVGTGGMDAGTGGSGPLPSTTIYVAGDSTVSTYADTPSPTDQAGWGQMLHEIFDDRVTVDNRAMGGRTALWFHLEGGTKYVLDRIQPGEYWFIQFGTNDSHTTATFEVNGVTYQRFADANTTFKDHLMDHYVVPARAKNAVPVLVTPPPRNSGYCGNGNSLGGYAQAMRDLAQAEGIVLLDLNQRTFDHLSAICPAPTPENFFAFRADGSVDGTHFQENGARHMAGFLGDEMVAKSAGPYLYLLP